MTAKMIITQECIDKLHIIETKVSVLEERSDTSRKMQEDIQKDVKQLLQDVGGLKVKAGIWGGLSGFIPATIMAVISFIRNHG